MESAINEGVAETILQQLGGNKFIAMTGAKDLQSKGNLLSMKFPRTFNGVNYLTIKLNSWDTYDLDFGYLSGNNVRRVALKTGVMANDLQEIFTEVTGLYTHL